MILVDANIIMYACGREHPLKAPSIAFLETVARREVGATTDAEVLQEILHRYRSVGRWEVGEVAYTLARTVLPDILPITAGVVDRAAELMRSHPFLVARDAIHLAVVQLHHLNGICSFDGGLDRVPGVRRIEPPSTAGRG